MDSENVVVLKKSKNVRKGTDYTFENLKYNLSTSCTFFNLYSPSKSINSLIYKDEKNLGFFSKEGEDARLVFKFLAKSHYTYVWTEFHDSKINRNILVAGFLVTGNRYFVSSERWLDQTEAYLIE